MKTTEIKEDPLTKDLYIELDEDTWNELGWQIGDSVIWEEHQCNWRVRKKDDATLGQTE